MSSYERLYSTCTESMPAEPLLNLLASCSAAVGAQPCGPANFQNVPCSATLQHDCCCEEGTPEPSADPTAAEVCPVGAEPCGTNPTNPFGPPPEPCSATTCMQSSCCCENAGTGGGITQPPRLSTDCSPLQMGMYTRCVEDCATCQPLMSTYSTVVGQCTLPSDYDGVSNTAVDSMHSTCVITDCPVDLQLCLESDTFTPSCSSTVNFGCCCDVSGPAPPPSPAVLEPMGVCRH